MKKLGLSLAGVTLAWFVGCGSGGSSGNGTTGATSAGGSGPATSATGAGAGVGGGTAATGVGGATTAASVSAGGAAGPTSVVAAAGPVTSVGGAAAASVGGGANVATTTGGGGSGGMLIRPSLVTSGPQAGYWNVGEVTAGGASATVTVNSTQTYQTWAGWGGTFNEAGWAALAALDAAQQAEILTLLFSINGGLGLDWGRIPIGPSDYAIDRYTLSSGPGQFDITRDESYLIPFVQSAQAIKGDIKYWASPWTPPPWMKTGQTEEGGYDKGYFNTDNYQEYADFFVKWIQAYQDHGIPIHSVMPQNEPGWAQSYPTCAFGPARDSTNSTDIPNPVTLGTFVDGYLYPALDAAGLDVGVWMGTLSNNTFFPDYWNDMMGKATASRLLGAALQWETQASISTVRSSMPDKLIMQSEHKCGNYPWLGQAATSRADATRDNFLSTQAPNNQAYGEESWDLIKSWIEDGVHIYSAWNMVLDIYGWNLDEVRPWPQNAMISVDTSARTYEITPYYYVFRHVAQYVDEGAVRVDISGNSLAFKNPDGSIVAIMFNEGSSAAATTLSVDGNMMQFEIPARGWATVNWVG